MDGYFISVLTRHPVLTTFNYIGDGKETDYFNSMQLFITILTYK